MSKPMQKTIGCQTFTVPGPGEKMKSDMGNITVQQLEEFLEWAPDALILMKRAHIYFDDLKVGHYFVFPSHDLCYL